MSYEVPFKVDIRLIYQFDLDLFSIQISLQYLTDLLSDRESDQNIKMYFVYQADFTRTDIRHLIFSVSQIGKCAVFSNNKGAFSAIHSKQKLLRTTQIYGILEQVNTF